MTEPSGLACPRCGETHALGGRPAADGIEVTCQVCGESWLRGARRCRTCGGPDVVEAAQRMTRHPRGTLRSVIGHRTVALCPRCDAAVIATLTSPAESVPETYVSRFLVSEAELPPPVEPAPGPRPRSRATAPRPSARPQASAQPRPAPDPPVPAPKGPADPTVREAVEALLTSRDDVDPTTLVLLGTRLGAATRLSRLDVEATRADVEAWLDRTWGTTESPKRTRAVTTVGITMDHWRQQGWLTLDLRPHRG